MYAPPVCSPNPAEDQRPPANRPGMPHPRPSDHRRRKFEAVIVCVNYADFLVQTLPHIRHIFDRIVVVTSTKDGYTQQVCDYYRVECLQTDAFYDDGATFNKARGINAGLAALDKDGWVVHLDADIYLPPWTRTILDQVYLCPDSIYGIDRQMCRSFEGWVNFLARPILMHEFYYLVHARAFPLGSRVAHYNQADGYFPIGFFQLWNPRRSGIERYPENSPGADHTDVVFSKSFPLGCRRLMPEFYAIHLESEKSPMGINWNGRSSQPFCLQPGEAMEPVTTNLKSTV